MQHTTKYTLLFKKFLIKANLNPNFETLRREVLADYITWFYTSLRTRNGHFYAPATLLCIRAAIQRHLRTFQGGNKCNIVTDPAFSEANKSLRNMVVAFSCSGGKIKHYNAITPQDLHKIWNHFDRSTPVILQEEVIFLVFVQLWADW